MNARRNIFLAGLLCLPLLAAGCGLEGDEESAPPPTTPTGTTATTQTTTTPQRPEELEPREDLPQPTQGVVEVNGEEKGSITADAVKGYSGGTVTARFDGATEALDQLCRGEIDIADSARPISLSEFQVCARNGLELTTFVVASDAVVVAIKNETDVGADCLTTTQVQRVFESGSTIDNWQDLSPNYANFHLETGGFNENNNSFDYFAQRVLDVDDDATLADYRSDYEPHETDTGTRRQVVGETQTELDRFIRVLNIRQQNLQVRITNQFDEIIPLDRRIKRLDRRIREFDTIIGAGVDPEERTIKRQRDRLARRRARLARRRVVLDRQRQALDRQRRELVNRLIPLIRQARLRERRVQGVVGLFRFSFYEQFENQLRPFEIEDNKTQTVRGGAQRNRCVFPSQSTITGLSYPLARRLLLFTTQRSLDRSDVRDFIRSYLLDSRELAIENRLVPNTEPQVNEQVERLAGFGESGTGTDGESDAQRDSGGGTSTTTTPTTTTPTTTTPELPDESSDEPSYLNEGDGG